MYRYAVFATCLSLIVSGLACSDDGGSGSAAPMPDAGEDTGGTDDTGGMDSAMDAAEDSGGDDAGEDVAEDVGDDAEMDADDGGMDPTGSVSVTRDERGVPHIEAESFAAAMYGLGWVQAEDRLFQMNFRRWRMQGRMAEHFAVEDPQTAAERTFNNKLISDDTDVRTMGFARSAAETANNLPAEHRELLEAFAAGVNDQMARRASLGTAFDEAGIDAVDPWTVADSLLAWDSITYTFGGPKGRIQAEIDNLVDCADRGCTPPSCGATVIDEDAASVPPPTDGMWPPGAEGHTASLFGREIPRPDVDVKASQGFVVSGDLVEGGSPLLFGEPQLSIEGPSTWYEAHLVVPSENINVRGAFFAGAPGAALFFNAHAGHTLTAGGGDLADLFQITRSRTDGNYIVDGADEQFTIVEEDLLVRGGDPVNLTIEVTRYGPVVDGILNGAPDGQSFAMRFAEHLRTDTHSVVAGIELLRVTSLESYRDALRHWVGPTVSAMYAGVDADDGEGHIAYHALVGIADRQPLRVGDRDLTGRHPYDGSNSSNDWAGILDLNWNPHVIDPSQGYILNGNSLPVGSWYDDHVYSGIGGNGDSYRSLELRFRLAEILGDGEPAPIADLHGLHVDSKSETILVFIDALQEMQRLGVLPDDEPDTTPRSRLLIGARVLTALEMWEAEGAGVLDQRVVASPLAAAILGRMVTAARQEPFACNWGAAAGGASHFLKEFAADPSVLQRDEQDMLLNAAELAWQTVSDDLGTDVRTWTGRTELQPFVVAYQRNFYCLQPGMGNGCSANNDHDRDAMIARNYTNTISSPHGSSWPFTVNFGDIDSSSTLLPPGIAEDPTSPWYFNVMPLIEAKGDGDIDSMLASPLDMSLVETMGEPLEMTYEP